MESIMLGGMLRILALPLSSVSLPLLIRWKSSAPHIHFQHPSTPTSWEFPLWVCEGKHFSRGYLIDLPSSLFTPVSLPSANTDRAPAVEPGLALCGDATVSKMQSSRSSQLGEQQVKQPIRLVWETLTRTERLRSGCPQVMSTVAFAFYPEIPRRNLF